MTRKIEHVAKKTSTEALHLTLIRERSYFRKRKEVKTTYDVCKMKSFSSYHISLAAIFLIFLALLKFCIDNDF